MNRGDIRMIDKNTLRFFIPRFFAGVICVTATMFPTEVVAGGNIQSPSISTPPIDDLKDVNSECGTGWGQASSNTGAFVSQLGTNFILNGSTSYTSTNNSGYHAVVTKRWIQVITQPGGIR